MQPEAGGLRPEAWRTNGHPLRIGFDAIRALRNTTGLGNYARGVLRALHQYARSLELHLYSPAPPRPEFADFPREIDAELHLPTGDGTSAAPGLGPQASGLRRSIWRTFRLRRHAARDGIQLYHGLSHEIPRDLPRTGIPSVATFHDLIYEREPRRFPLFDRWSYRWRYRWSADHATMIVAVSARTRDDLVECYRLDPARIVVVPPPRDAAFAASFSDAARASIRAKYGLPSEFMLSVGTLEPRKNHRVLVAAAEQLTGSDAVPLVLVGRNGGTLAALRAQVAALRLGRRVYILPDVSASDLPAVMASAALFLYPSQIEGFGMPIVEALSAGVPVIAAGGGHLTQAGGPDTRYVPADDPAAWVAAISEILGDGPLASRMRQTGATYARRFDGDVVAGRLMAVYEAVLGGDRVTESTRSPLILRSHRSTSAPEADVDRSS